MARAIVRKIEARPQMLDELRDCIERAWGGDPSKTRMLRLWRSLLQRSQQEFAKTILADTPEGEEARESFPPYVALTPAERAAFIEASRREVAVA